MAGADDDGGEGGAPAAIAGKGGSGGSAGKAGSGGSGGSSGSAGKAGSGGTGPVDGCATTTIGASNLPVPTAPATPVAKPSGAVGGLTVVNWAGFKGAISYTFDDSLLSQTTHYADLNAVGIKVTFYLNNFNQGNNKIWETAVADGHELGNHTVHHCRADSTQCVLAVTPFPGVDTEIDDNTTFLMAKAGMKGVYTFAAPYGDTNWIAPSKSRFLVARGIDDGNGILPTTDPNNGNIAWRLPCHISNEGEPAVPLPEAPQKGGFNLITDAARANGWWKTILMHNVDPAVNDYGYNPVALKEAVAAMTYTRDLGDVWADTVVAVGAYWIGQRAIPTTAKTVGSDKVYSWTLPAHFPPGKYLRVNVTGGKVKQCGTELTWDDHGYYEINLDAGSVTISP